VELCLSKTPRTRVWQRTPKSFKIELIAQLDRNSERLARAAFEDVAVTRVGPCGMTRAPFRLEFRILSADRVLPSLDDADQDTRTTVEIEGSLVGAQGEAVWTGSCEGSESVEFTSNWGKRGQAARDFGTALGRALRVCFDEIMTSDEIRDRVDHS